MSLNPPLHQWRGKRVWLVGASTGIGRATAEALHARGARVIVSARSPSPLHSFVDAHPGAQALPLDSTDRAAVAQAAQTLLADGQSTASIGRVTVFSTKRACPSCGTSYAELDPRLFSYNSKHGWCGTCVGTGLKLTREQRKAFDDSVRDEDNRGREQNFPSEETEVEGLIDEACPDCHGTRLSATARAVTA